MSKLRYVLVLAALYGPCSFAADPVATVEANRKIMYGTAAVRPTPDTFDLASRGMCYVATDTGTVTEWTGTAWITTATCPGSATAGGGTQYTEGDTDAEIDGTALMWEDAGDTLTPVNSSKPLPVVVYAPVLSGELTLSTTDGPDASGTKSIVGDGIALNGQTYCTVTIKNVGDGGGGAPTLDELDIYLLTNDEAAEESFPIYDETKFESPPGDLKISVSGTPGGTRDATPDTTLDEGKTWKLKIAVAAYAALDIHASASDDNTSTETDWTCD